MILDHLKSKGFHFSFHRESLQGNYAADDVDWNFLDVPHLSHVHKSVNAVFTYIEDRVASSLYVFNIGPFKFVLPVTIFNPEPHFFYYYTALGPFVIYIEMRCRAIGTETLLTCDVLTDFYVGSQWFFKPLHWFIVQLLRINYRRLNAEDVPMRERRGFLRRHYSTHISFRPLKGFKDSLNISQDNVCMDDVVKKLQNPCPHEGGLMVKQGDLMICRWHGRKIRCYE